MRSAYGGRSRTLWSCSAPPPTLPPPAVSSRVFRRRLERLRTDEAEKALELQRAASRALLIHGEATTLRRHEGTVREWEAVRARQVTARSSSLAPALPLPEHDLPQMIYSQEPIRTIYLISRCACFQETIGRSLSALSLSRALSPALSPGPTRGCSSATAASPSATAHAPHLSPGPGAVEMGTPGGHVAA